MLSSSELRLVWLGVKRLLRFDPEGVNFFRPDWRGFLHSFAAALIQMPLWTLFLLTDLLYPDTPALRPVNMPLWIQAQVVGYVLSWLAYPYLLLRLPGVLSSRAQFLRYLTLYNWMQIPLSLLWLPLLLALLTHGDGLSRMAVADYSLLVHALQAGYCWMMLRVGLRTTIPATIGLVLLDPLLSALISNIVGRIGTAG